VIFLQLCVCVYVQRQQDYGSNESAINAAVPTTEKCSTKLNRKVRETALEESEKKCVCLLSAAGEKSGENDKKFLRKKECVL
jgi:hypothetical protein